MPTLAESTKKIDMNQFEEPQAPTISRGGPAGEPTYPSYPRFLATALPLSVTYQPDALRQFYRGGVPQSRIIPPQQ